MPKLLGIDPGQRWVGLATSDESQSIAVPLKVIDRESVALGDELRDVTEEESIGHVVVGYPDPLKVEENERTRQVDRFIEEFVEPLPVTFETISERYSTKEARRKRRERDQNGEPDDDEAAAIILQTYLDRSSETSSNPQDPGPGHE